MMLSSKHALVVFLAVIAGLLSGYYAYMKRVVPPKTPAAKNTTVTSAPQPTATSTTATPASAVKKITATIGVILPLTGVQAVYGQGIKEGLDLAADGVNKTTKFSIRLNLIYEDTMSEVKNAPAAARKLMSQDHAVIVITGLSPTSLAVAPIAEKNKVVLFTMASLATALNDAGAFVFKNDDVSSRLGAGLANAARERKFASAGVLYANYNDSVVESKDAFVTTFETAGGAITSEEGFTGSESESHGLQAVAEGRVRQQANYNRGSAEPTPLQLPSPDAPTVRSGRGFTQDTTDFRTPIQKIIALKPETVAIFGLQRDCALAIIELRQLGYQKPLFGFTCIDDPMVVAAAGASVEGTVLVSFNAPPTEKFSNLIKKKYGHEPLRWSAEAFDGLKVLAIAASRAYDGTNPLTSDNIREALTHITGYTGEAGTVTFDQDGNAHRTLFVKRVEKGKIEVIR